MLRATDKSAIAMGLRSCAKTFIDQLDDFVVWEWLGGLKSEVQHPLK
jgi:hypothetical protein